MPVAEWFQEVLHKLKQPLAVDVGILTLCRYFAAGLNFLTSIIAARLLGPTDFGVATLVMAYPAFLFSFTSIKSSPIVIRYLSNYIATNRTEEIKSICKLGYGLDFLFSIFSFLLLIATGPFVSNYLYRRPEMFILMAGYAISFLFLSFSGTSTAVLTSYQRFRLLGVVLPLDAILRLLSMIVFLLSGWGISGMVLAYAVGHVFSGIVMIVLVTIVLYHKVAGSWWRAPLVEHIASLRQELVSLFSWNYLSVTFSGIMEQVPVMLLGSIRGSEEAGFYRLVVNLARVVGYPEGAMGRVAYPNLSERWAAGQRKSLKETLMRWTMHAGLPAGALIVILIPFLPILVPLAFGDKYLPIVPAAQIMFFGSAIESVFFWLNSIYYASGQISRWTQGYGLYTGLVIGFTSVVAGWWGFVGVVSLVTTGKIVFTALLVRFLNLS